MSDKEKTEPKCIECEYNNFITNANCFDCVDKSRFKLKTEPEKGLYTLHLNGDEFNFKRTTHPFTEYNNMVHRGIGMKLMPYNTEKELIEKFLEKLEFLRDKVLEAPILSGDVQDLRDYIHDLKDLVVKNINEYAGG